MKSNEFITERGRNGSDEFAVDPNAKPAEIPAWLKKAGTWLGNKIGLKEPVALPDYTASNQQDAASRSGYTGIDPVQRANAGMAPATQQEINRYMRDNPAVVGGLTDRNGNPIASGGAQEVERAARAAAPRRGADFDVDAEVGAVDPAVIGNRFKTPRELGFQPGGSTTPSGGKPGESRQAQAAASTGAGEYPFGTFNNDMAADKAKISEMNRILELSGLLKSSEFLNEAGPTDSGYVNMGLKQQPIPALGSTVAWDAPLYVNQPLGAPLPSGDPIENVKAGIQDAKEFYDLARKAGMPIGDAIPLAYKAGVATATGDIGGMVQAVTATSNKNFVKGIQQLKSTIKDYTDLYAQMLPTSEYYKKNIAPNPQLKAQADEFIKTNMTPQQFAQSIQQAEATLKAPSTMPTQASPTVPSAQAALGQPASQPAAPANETAELNRILKLSGMEFIAEGSTKSITVQRGDTLGRIAQDNSTTVAAIVKLNNIANPDRIYPGDVIRIPGGQGDPGGIKKRQGAGQSDQSEKRTKTTTSTGNAKIAMEFFLEQGWTPEQAAGLVANLQAESYDRLDPAALGDKGRGYGIAQWHGPRQKKFEEIIGVPLKGSSLENQLKFVQWELTNPESAERSAGTRLKSAKTAADAAAVIDEFYERSSGIHRQRRIAKAEALLTAVA